MEKAFNYLEVTVENFLVSASAQVRPELRCFECSDCANVDQNTFIRNCYQSVTNPSTQTPPATSKLNLAALYEQFFLMNFFVNSFIDAERGGNHESYSAE
jgi:hypothetical protein